MPRSLFGALNQRHGKTADPLTRRQMLKTTLAAGAGLLLSQGRALSDEEGKGKRIAVIGAGFAGLAAAHELAAAGYAVTVYEARNRVGGRVLSFGDFVAGRNVEGGAELIGSNHPTWVAYAKKFGLEFLDVTEDQEAEAPIYLGGKRLDEKESNALWEEMKAALSKMNGDAEKIDAAEPWKSADAAALDKRSTAAWIEAQNISALCKTGITAQLTADNGSLTAWQSYLGNLAQVKGGGVEKYWTDSEVYRCKGGNQQLAQQLAKTLGEKRINLSTPVLAIKTGQKGAVLTLAGGKTTEVDDVVLAVPPSVWKKIAFDPPLPPSFLPQMGSNVKFLMELKARFWKEKKLSPDSLQDGPVQMTWEGTDNQAGPGNVALVAFSGGQSAETCRQWPAGEREDNYLRDLERLYADLRKNFVKARMMDWPSDPWTGASYSFPAPGQVTTIGPLLQEGFGPLHFAGEHCCYAFVGYMEGALNSGVALARRLAKRDGLQK